MHHDNNNGTATRKPLRRPTPAPETTLYIPPRPPANAPELLTAQAVAAVLMISVRTVWRMVERGQFIQPIRWNRKLIRWPAPLVRAWVEEQAERQAAYEAKIEQQRAAYRASVTDAAVLERLAAAGIITTSNH